MLIFVWWNFTHRKDSKIFFPIETLPQKVMRTLLVSYLVNKCCKKYANKKAWDGQTLKILIVKELKT